MTEEINEKLKKEEDKPYLGHRQRVRDRFRATGFDGMNDYEKLELLLMFAIQRKDTKPIAKRLIERFGDIARVFEATEQQLCEVKGLTPNAALLLRMIVPLLEEYHSINAESRAVTDSGSCARMLCEKYKGVMQEKVFIVCTDAACKVLAIEEVCEGDISSVNVNCRRLVEIVLKYPRTVAIILAHNHPGGLALPSREDILSTAELFKTLGCMGINLVDHIVVADDDYISMAQSPKFSGVFRR